MLVDTPFEEPFRVIVWLVIGIPIALVILSVFLMLLTVKVTIFLATLAIIGSFFVYIAGAIRIVVTWIYERLTWLRQPPPEPPPEPAERTDLLTPTELGDRDRRPRASDGYRGSWVP